MFDTEILNRCQQITAEACADFDATPAEFNRTEDHVHLSVQYPPKVALSHPVKFLQDVPSRHDFVGKLNKAAMHARYWPPSHLSGSCGGPPLAIAKDYTVHQKRPD